VIIQWSAAARSDVARISSHIAEENPRAAMKVTRELLLAGDSLVLFPDRGRPGLVAGTRELVIAWPYILVYEIVADENLVRILRIWHGAQER
jgi:toxin ParE1/3/4